MNPKTAPLSTGTLASRVPGTWYCLLDNLLLLCLLLSYNTYRINT